jgi:hypothetical protein
MADAVARDVPVDMVAAAPALRGPARMRSWPDAEVARNAEALVERIRHDLEEL